MPTSSNLLQVRLSDVSVLFAMRTCKEEQNTKPDTNDGKTSSIQRRRKGDKGVHAYILLLCPAYKGQMRVLLSHSHGN